MLPSAALRKQQQRLWEDEGNSDSCRGDRRRRSWGTSPARFSQRISCFLLVLAAMCSGCAAAEGAGLLRLRGGRKGVTAKHTAKEIAAKQAAATRNVGAGAAGIKDRAGGAAGHAKFVCPLCKMQAPSIKNMQEHHESKHSKLPFDPDACVDIQAQLGGSTQGVGVHGTLKKSKKLAKEKDDK